MRTLTAGAAGALMLAFAAIPASAAPGIGIGTATSGVIQSGLSQVRYDRPSLPPAFWLRRCADGHCGYWHRTEHRWRDGWHKGPRHVDRYRKWHRYSNR